MQLNTANGTILSLNFEPIMSRATDPRNYIDTIVGQINGGWYDGMIQGGTVIDLGANIGLFTLYAANKADRVIALEPSPEHFADLRRVLDTILLPHVTPLQAAITTEDGYVDFYLNDDNRTMSALFPTGHYRKVVVRGLTLPALFEEFGIDRIDFLKCDIEGAEEDLLSHPTFDQVAPLIHSALVEVHNFKTWCDGNAIADRVEKLMQKSFPHTRRLHRDAIYGWRE